MKKLLCVLLCAVMLFGLNSTCYAEETAVNVFITVTDITDVDQPINTLVRRHKVNVEYSDLSKQYGSSFTGIECIDGITYMHALVALHKELYGAEGVTENLMLTPDGETHLFMGKSIDSIMYKNGEDIFSLPQNVPLHEGDEVNICLYNAGHPQKVATFDRAVIENIAPGEQIYLSLYEHYESPRNKNPIEGAEITDENGIYILDDNGNIITTDIEGAFSVKFDNIGDYQVSIMPQIDYYYDKNGGTTIIEYVPKEVIKKVPKGYWFTYPDFSESEWVGELVDAYNKDYPDEPLQGNILAFEWVDNEEDITYPFYDEETTTILEKVEIFMPGEATQHIEYTPPYCVVEVTDKLIVDNVQLYTDEEKDTIHLVLKNADYNAGQVICAAYNGDTYIGMQTKDIRAREVFVFDKGATRYKVMFWESLESLKPLTNAEEVK